MKKKMISIALLMTLLIPNLFAYNFDEQVKQKTKPKLWKMITGVVLISAGTYMAIDGFSSIDISNPKVEILKTNVDKKIQVDYDSNTNTYITTWIITTTGEIKNTGNTDILHAKIKQDYYNSVGILLYTETFDSDKNYKSGLIAIKPQEIDSFDGTHYLRFSTEPNVVVSISSFDFGKNITEKNGFEGRAGLVISAVGLFFAFDYFNEKILGKSILSKKSKTYLSSNFKNNSLNISLCKTF